MTISTQQIDELAEAIYDQCDMRANVRKSWSRFGLEVSVQVMLVPEADPKVSEHWWFTQAFGEAELPRLRDELVDFIAANRKAEVAA